MAIVVIACGFLQPWLFIAGVPVLLVAGKMTQRSEGLTPFASDLRKDAKRGVVHVARGTIGDLVIADLVSPRDRDPDPISIDVLPHSGLVLKRNGRSLPDEILVPITETSALPEQAAMAANFVRPTSREDVFAHQRAMTEAELRELDRYAPKVELPMYVITALLAIIWIVLVAMSIRGSVAAFFPLYGAIPVALVAHSTWRRWNNRRHIAGDLAAAFVVIVRVRDGEGLAPSQEYLPSSGILWTSNGAPANWRKVVE